MTCKSCTDRVIGCHSRCVTYITERIELDRINAVRNAGNECRTTTNGMQKHQTGVLKFKQRVKAGYIL